MANLEELKRRLYKRGEGFLERGRFPDLSKKDFKKEFEESPKAQFIKKINLRKFMNFKVLFLILAAVVAIALILFSNVFDFQNIDLKIEGEKSIKSGEKVLWNVTVSNKNKKDIHEAALVFSIPDILRERVNMGTLKSGEIVKHEFESVIFGGRGKNFEARAVFEYKPEGSSSIFAKESLFSFVIAQSPVTVSFLMPDEARANGKLNFEVKYFSQSDSRLENLFLKIDYPANFEYKSSDKKPAEANSLWFLGNLNSGEEGSIKVFGNLKDLVSGVSSFGVSIGFEDGDKLLILDESLQAITSRSPYLGIDILPKGEEKYIASIGEEIPFLVNWKNNLPETVEDAFVEVFIDGEAADLNSIRVRDGSFISGEKKIIWNSSSNKDFEKISPGGSGFVGFSLKIKKDLTLKTGQKPVLKLKAYFKSGKEIPGFESNVVFGEDEIEVPISSIIQFSAKGFYFESSLQNTGPLPPKVGKETTYSIVWSLANPLNNIKNVVVKSTLPPYSSFKEVFMPASADIVFDKNTGIIEWRVGTLEAGTGFLKPALSLSFQVNIVPSITHVGFAPQILSSAEASGIDSVTEKTLFASQKEITTDLPDDPLIDFSHKTVAE